MMLQEATIHRPDYKVHFRSYSEKIRGLRVILHGEEHYIINSKLTSDAAISTLYKLKDVSAKYNDYTFVMLQEGDKLYVEPDSKFNKATNRYSRDRSRKVIDLKKYRYALKNGTEKFKDRWES